MKWRWLWVVAVVMAVSSCTINRDIMFKTPVDHVFDTPPDSGTKAFKIQPNDMLTFRLFANDGFRMIDLVDEQQGVRNLNRMSFNYLVDWDGTAKLPLLGPVKVSDLTVRQAEMFLEGAYAKYYERPFVQLFVNNRRVVVFPGGGGDARVVPLENTNTTLMEALAEAGGVAKRGDARRVKVFRRKPDGGRHVYQFDMSDISGLKHADLVMQADDIVYVQPNPEIAREAISDLNPIITLLTTTILVIGIVQGLSR
jgi:polysaccharide export outer membrane protein